MNANILILNKKLLLTFVLILFSVGSYTFSEITATSFQTEKSTESNLVFMKSTNYNFPIYYLTPASYLIKSSEEIVELKTPSERIMDKGKITSGTLANFLKNNNQNIDFLYIQNIADLYLEEAKLEGVNPDIAFAQMCLETGFLRFDGTVDKQQNNFCGLGVIGNGVKGLAFKDARQGVRAHIQHIKAYASTKDLNNKLVDTRFKFVKRGSGKYISELTGKWATDSKYDKKIRSLLDRLYKFSE
ncbi:MAG TPA: glucosaminidase domain-containing protein [Bacteroidales bacterium]|nr:glucosaminidase domain-containing protein [Bacteroidales bacterium]